MFPTKMGLMGSWSKGDSSKDHLRALQLDMRLQEVYETYHSFRRLVSSEGGRPKMNDEKADEATTTKFLESITDRIDLENVHLTGHSFGGGTMVSTLSPPYTLPLIYSYISFKHHLLRILFWRQYPSSDV
jgi:hypothetical protein